MALVDRSAEELADYEGSLGGIETKLGQLTTTVRIGIGILVIVLGSQLALWQQIGELRGELKGELGQINARLGQLVPK